MIAIIDYGLGNIRAFSNVYKKLNIPSKIVSDKKDLKNITKIILPGVGAFDYAMERLKTSGMQEMLTDLVMHQKIPVLGICVGMQILALSSEEGKLKGLGWINGEVKRFNTTALAQGTLLPHMGWNSIRPMKNDKLLKELEIGSRFYFLHSYYFHCHNSKDVIAETDYGGLFTSAVKSGNIYGVQFHPEKSHHNGIQILNNYWNL